MVETIEWSPVLETGYYCGVPRYQETDFRGHHFIIGSILDTFVMAEVDDVECERYVGPFAGGWSQGAVLEMTVMAKIDGKLIDIPVKNTIEKVNDWLRENIEDNKT